MTYVMRDLEIRLACLPNETTREHVGNAMEALKAAYARLEAIRRDRLVVLNGSSKAEDGAAYDPELRYATIGRDKIAEALACVGRFLADVDSGMVKA